MKPSHQREFVNGLNVSRRGGADQLGRHPRGGRLKTMPIVFFDSKGLIHKEFLPESTTWNAVAYSVLKRLLQRIRRVCPEYAKQGSWTLLLDNAWAIHCLGCTAVPCREWSCIT
ncbi:hypothetical protein TNCV_832681 [Trichonephila clavipes]|nr:hypothetical protein TNCV_832681 [Trichonephila clavipes]